MSMIGKCIFFFFLLRIDRSDKKAVSEANKYFLIEGSIALFVSFILNLFVIGVFANLFADDLTYQEAYDTCNSTNSIYTDVLYNDHGP